MKWGIIQERMLKVVRHELLRSFIQQFREILQNSFNTHTLTSELTLIIFRIRLNVEKSLFHK